MNRRGSDFCGDYSGEGVVFFHSLPAVCANQRWALTSVGRVDHAAEGPPRGTPRGRC